MTRGSSREGRPRYLPKNTGRAVWEKVDNSQTTKCKKCGIKIWKWWNISNEEMTKCNNCLNKRK